MLSPKRITKVSWSSPSKLLVEVVDGKTGSVTVTEFDYAKCRKASSRAHSVDIVSETTSDQSTVENEEVEPHD